ncbi:DUF4013 domain-containing protein [Methanoregula sp.]|uniref:DUF4013 domain-containing protein n=1 Tax=Methanoregula sp. TaxID=2052170 RepID=UPI0023704382|nr:DUF4013 domain-containing protein [Methanoregula sp.]MDD1685494.1 DUF4013 domain-containing protein [Methanoregula sp.]
MDYGSVLGDSFGYAKDSVIGKWKQWLLFLIATILLTIPLLGYVLKVFRGEKPAPEVDGWGTLIIDGIKYAIVSIIWAIPCIIILVLLAGSLIGAIATMNTAAMMAFVTGAIISFILLVIVAIITGLLATIGIIRFARTGSMGEAFNFGAILETIGKIGWGTYIIAMIVLIIVQVIFFAVISGLNMIVPMLGLVVEFIILAPYSIFVARYLCQVYDAAGTA